MSGETESQVSGWTVDTLHAHVITQFDITRGAQEIRVKLLQEELDRRLGNMQKAIDDRRADLRDLLTGQIAGLREMLNERYATQTKALDAAFLAQQTAMRTALEVAEKAVQTALVSAEKAVAKAEVAAEKRFESVNEFRAQLTDQAATFPTRNEVDVRLNAIADKLDTEAKRGTLRAADLELRLTATTSDLDKRVTSRLDLIQGGASSNREFRATQLDENRYTQDERIARAAASRASVSIAIAAMSALVTVVAVIFAIVHG